MRSVQIVLHVRKHTNGNDDGALKMKGYACFLFLAVVLLAVGSIGFPSHSLAKKAFSTADIGYSIQQAINNASNGDVINIPSGTYHEYPIIVNKTVTLVGANADTTVVDGDGNQSAILLVHADGVNIRNLTIQNTSNSGGIGISITDYVNLEVYDCVIKQCYYGMYFVNANDSIVARNTIKDNYANGIYIHAPSSYNHIFGNMIENNTVGVSIDYGCQKNLLYYNDFIDNANQTLGFGRTATYWNETYPNGGNFWSDYVGLDLNHGPYQDVIGSDGIGDTNYTLIGEAADFYPLMAPVHYFYSGTWNSQEYYVAIGTSSNVSNFGFYPDELPEPFINFTLADSNANSCRVTILRQMLFISPPENWTVEANQTVLNDVLILEDADFTYFYLNFTEASNVTIKTTGTGAIPEFARLFVPAVLTTSLVFVLVKKRKRK